MLDAARGASAIKSTFALGAGTTTEVALALDSEVRMLQARALRNAPLLDADYARSPDVSLLIGGYYAQAAALLSDQSAEPAFAVHAAFSPRTLAASYPILIIPSGGLYGLDKSETFRAALAEYVSLGGTLLVLDQQHGAEFEALPGGELKGYGWREAWSCTWGNTEIAEYSPALASLAGEVADTTQDGFFTSWPASSTVLLKGVTRAGGQPVMLAYPYGRGRVIATTLVPDWAYGMGQASEEEIGLIQDIVSWAKGEPLVAAGPGESVTVTQSVHNLTETTATHVRLSLSGPDRQHEASVAVLPLVLPPSAAGTVVATFQAPASSGIHFVDWTLLGPDGGVVQPQAQGARLVVSGLSAVPGGYQVSRSGVSIVIDGPERAPAGSEAVFQVRVANASDEAITLQGSVADEFHEPLVAAGETTTIAVTVPKVTRSAWVVVDAYGRGGLIARSTKSCWAFQPAVDVKVTPRLTSLPYSTRRVEATVSVAGVATQDQTVTVRTTLHSPDGVVVDSVDETVRVASGATRLLSGELPIPEAAPFGVWAIRAEARSGQVRAGLGARAITLEPPALEVVPSVPDSIDSQHPLTVKVTSSEPLAVPLELNAGLTDPLGTLVAVDGAQALLAAGESTLAVLRLPDGNPLIGQYRFSWLVRVAGRDLAKGSAPLSSAVQVRLGSPTTMMLQAGDDLDVDVFAKNAGRFAVEAPLIVSLDGADVELTELVRIEATQEVSRSVTLHVPESASAGSYLLSAAVSGIATSPATTIVVPRARFVVSLDSTPSAAGDTGFLAVKNVGGVRGQCMVRANVADQFSLVVSNVGTTLALGPGERREVPFLVDAHAKPGRYVIEYGQVGVETRRVVELGGVSASLRAKTDRDTYRLAQPVGVLTTIAAEGGTLAAARLEQRIYSTQPAATGSGEDEWRFFPGRSDVLAMAQDGQDMWVLERNGVVRRFDGATGAWSEHFFADLGGGDLGAIAADADYVWVGSFDRPLHLRRYSKSDGTWTEFRNEAFARPTDSYRGNYYEFQVTSLALDGTRVWVGTGGGGVFELDTTTGTWIRHTVQSSGWILPSNNVAGLAVAAGKLWVGTYEWGRALVSFDLLARTWSRPSWYFAGEGLAGISDLCADGDFLYAATSTGIVRVRASNPGEKAVFSRTTAGLPGDHVNRIAARDGRVWAHVTQPGNEPPWPLVMVDTVASTCMALPIPVAQYSYPRVSVAPGGAWFYSGQGEFWRGDFTGQIAPVHPPEAPFDDVVEVAAVGSMAYGVDRSETLYALDSESGRWRFVRAFPGSGISSWSGADSSRDSLAAGDNELWVAAGTTLSRLDTIQETWRDFQLPFAFDSVAVFGQRAFVLNDWMAAEVDRVNGRLSYSLMGSQLSAATAPADVWLASSGTHSVYHPGSEPSPPEVNPEGVWWPEGQIAAVPVPEALAPYGVGRALAAGERSAWFSPSYDSRTVLRYDTLSGLWQGLVLPDGRKHGGNLAAATSKDALFPAYGIAPWWEDPAVRDGLAARSESTGDWSFETLRAIGMVESQPVARDVEVESEGEAVWVAGSGGVGRRASGVAPGGGVWWSRETSGIAGSTFDDAVNAGTAPVAGKHFLENRLANSLGQVLEESSAAFYVFPGDITLTLAADRAAYRLSDTVLLRAVVGNESASAPLSERLVLTVGSETLLDVPVSLAPGEERVLEATCSASGGLEAVASLDDIDVREPIVVGTPLVSWDVTAPSVVGRDPFDVAVTLSNSGDVYGEVDLGIQGVPARVTIAPGAKELVSRSLNIADDVTVTVRATGDLDAERLLPVKLGERVSVKAMPDDRYAEGTVAIPVVASGLGELSSLVDVRAKMGSIEAASRLSLMVAPAESVTGTALFESVPAGVHRLTLEWPGGAHESTVTVVRAVDMRLEAGIARLTGSSTDGGSSQPSVVATVANDGMAPFEGLLVAEVADRRFDTTVAVEPGAALESRVPLDVTDVEPGRYQVRLTLVDALGHEEATRLLDLVVTRARFEAQVAVLATRVAAGQTLDVTVSVVNTGDEEGASVAQLDVPGIQTDERAFVLGAGEGAFWPVQIPLPEDLPDGVQSLRWRLDDGPWSTTSVTIEGADVTATASLDRSSYRVGDTAWLTVHVGEESDAYAGPLTVRAALGSEQATRELPTGSGTVALPLTVVSGEDRVTYSIYSESGRALHIDTLYLRVEGATVSVTPDKSVYEPGDSVRLSVDSSVEGTLSLDGPNIFRDVRLPETTIVTFVLPRSMRAGTYQVDWRLGDHNGMARFDVRGLSVKVADSWLDKHETQAQDNLRLGLLVEAASDMTATITGRLVAPSGSRAIVFEEPISLDVGVNTMTIPAAFETSETGAHRLSYVVHKGPALALASGSEAFDVEGVSLVGAAPTRAEYPDTIEEPLALVELSGHGTTSLSIMVDGEESGPVVASVAGYRALAVGLGRLAPGVHRAVVSCPGSVAREFAFTVGSALPDLGFGSKPLQVEAEGIADASDARLAVTVRNLGLTAAEDVLLRVRGLESTGVVVEVGSVTIPVVPASGEASAVLPFDLFAWSGRHVFEVAADPQSGVQEFSEADNVGWQVLEVESPVRVSVSVAATDTVRALAWTGSDAQAELVSDLLRDARASFKVYRSTSSSVQFLRDMRSGYFNQFWVMPGAHPLPDHVSAELIERVNAGAGLIVADPTAVQSWKLGGADVDVLGIKRIGLLGRGLTIDFSDSDLGSASVELVGTAARIEATTARVAATARDSRGMGSTASVNRHGRGVAVYLGFDPSDVVSAASKAALQAVLERAAALAHPAAVSDDAMAVVPVTVSVGSGSAGAALRVHVAATEGGKLATSDEPATGRDATEWTVALSPGETRTTELQLVLPDSTGSAGVDVNASYVRASDGAVLPFAAERARTMVRADEGTLLEEARHEIQRLLSAGASGQDKARLSQIGSALDSLSAGGSTAGRDPDITVLLKAAADAERIGAQAADLRLVLDRLLATKEAEWASAP